ncbi:MAG: uncharacterized ferritin-like protein (DUF455 family) [Pseudohongiellaceae bacterium]|jgi:uncharacterized ferritin-like protein (DUF455 family)
METVRDYALAVVTGSELTDKLIPPPKGLVDEPRGPSLLLEAPGRPEFLRPQPGAPMKVPAPQGMADPEQLRRVLHAFANHELQAVELFAWGLLAFPDAPAEFRRGLLSTLGDEQRHLQLYLQRLDDLDVSFGRWPVSGYFWNKLEHFATPLKFVCSMCLTFENANLDHTLDYARAADSAGDEATAAALRQVHHEERAHVAFGLRWLESFKDPGDSLMEAWLSGLSWPLRPALARGRSFSPEVRQGLGFDAEWIALLAGAQRR